MTIKHKKRGILPLPKNVKTVSFTAELAQS